MNAERPPSIEITLADQPSAERLDVFIAGRYSDISRSRAVRLLRSGYITVNGEKARPNQRPRMGDKICINMPTTTETLVPEHSPVDILLEDPEFAVINKPAGIIMHPGSGVSCGTLAHRLVAKFPETHLVGHPKRPGIVHRLDKETSGVVVVARTSEIYLHLTQAFERREIQKRYLLIVNGTPRSEQGIVEAPIGRHPSRRTHMAVTSNGRPSKTYYKVLDKSGSQALVQVQPITGRTHQIRVHMAAIGHPIVGDSTYGTKSPDGLRTLLHAWTIEFTDHIDRSWLVACPPPNDFKQAAESLKLALPKTPNSTLQTRYR